MSPGRRTVDSAAPTPTPASLAYAETFDAAFEFAPIGMALLNLDSTTLRVNHAFSEMLGYSEREFAGVGSEGFVHPEDIDEDFQLRALMLSGAFPAYEREKRYLHRTGRTVWAYASCCLVHDRGGNPSNFLLHAQDITQRREAAQALRESEERFRATFEQAAVGILHIGLDGRILRVNEALCRMHGRSRDELLTMRADDLLADGGASRAADTAALLEGRVASYIAHRRFVRRNGETWPARVRVTLVKGGAAEPYFISVVEDLTDHERDQQRISEQAHALVLANSALEERIAQRTAELQESNRQLRNFAYSLAHDLRGPLASTDGFARQLQMHLGAQLDERGRHFLDRVRAGVVAMSQLTDALLSLANLSQEPLKCASVNLSALARSWLQRTREREPQRQAQVEIADTPQVQGDPRLLAVLVANLLDNAWKFTSRRDDARIVFRAEPDAGGLRFSVTDNGAGFDAEYADKLFKPFQRLHPANEFGGTGMGLAIVHSIVRKHGGRVWAEGAPGQGAAFHFTVG